jgi:hypothetical protein
MPKSVDDSQPKPTPAAQSCLPYSPAAVSLTGTMTAKSFAPEVTTTESSPETYWFLRLPSPVCASPSEGPSRGEVWNVQLLFANAEMYNTYSALLDHEVKVTGSLFQASSRQHHSDIVLEVGNIEEPIH